MTTLFRLDASIRLDGSVTRALADTVQTTLQATAGDLLVVRRDVGQEPVDAHLWAAASSAGQTAREDWTLHQVAATATAGRLADEVTSADVLLFAAPLYNYGVSQHFKAWFDLAATDPRLGPGATTLAGRPAVLVTARGGGYGPGTPREGWDHATGWMRRALADVWGLDLTVVEAELTLAEVVPAMAPLRDLAREVLDRAHQDAAAAGRAGSDRVRRVA